MTDHRGHGFITLLDPPVELRPVGEDELRSCLGERSRFAAVAGCEIAADWPPRFFDAAAVQWMLSRRCPGHDPAWECWFLRYVGPGTRRLIGTAGFKGPPDQSGTVEIGYSVVDSHQRRGIATRAAGMLVGWACTTGRVRRIIAHTLAGDPASGGVLLKNGFRATARLTDPTDGEVDRYEHTGPYHGASAHVHDRGGDAGSTPA